MHSKPTPTFSCSGKCFLNSRSSSSSSLRAVREFLLLYLYRLLSCSTFSWAMRSCSSHSLMISWKVTQSERSLFAFPGALAMKKGKTCYLFISHENKSTMVQKQIYANCQETKFQVTETKWASFSNCICSNPHFLNYPLPWCYVFTGTKTCYRRAHGSFQSGVKVVVY